jgi:hypothetical protein
MTQADSVHSTPRTNAPTSRRRFLSTAATLAAGSAALALAIPPAAAAESDDPIFAMIERHRELSAHCKAAYDISGKLLDGPEFDAAEAVSVEKHDRLIDHADALIGCEPTTIAGVLAAIAGFFHLSNLHQRRARFFLILLNLRGGGGDSGTRCIEFRGVASN